MDEMAPFFINITSWGSVSYPAMEIITLMITFYVLGIMVSIKWAICAAVTLRDSLIQPVRDVFSTQSKYTYKHATSWLPFLHLLTIFFVNQLPSSSSAMWSAIFESICFIESYIYCFSKRVPTLRCWEVPDKAFIERACNGGTVWDA